MSKERAKRRTAREEAAAEAQAAHQARAARRARRSTLKRRLIPRPTRYRRPTGPLARRRRLQNRAVIAAVVLLQILGWLLLDTWPARLALLALSLFLTPVVVTLAFDRRR
jgi:Flp pilus assembly protein TadB